MTGWLEESKIGWIRGNGDIFGMRWLWRNKGLVDKKILQGWVSQVAFFLSGAWTLQRPFQIPEGLLKSCGNLWGIFLVSGPSPGDYFLSQSAFPDSVFNRWFLQGLFICIFRKSMRSEKFWTFLKTSEKFWKVLKTSEKFWNVVKSFEKWNPRAFFWMKF